MFDWTEQEKLFDLLVKSLPKYDDFHGHINSNDYNDLTDEDAQD